MILHDDKVLVVVKMNYNGNISQNPRMYDSKYIFKESIFRLSERTRLCELWKTKRTRSHIYRHNAWTHTYTHTHPLTRTHILMCTYARTQKHIHKYHKRSQATHAHTYTYAHIHAHHTHARTHIYTRRHKRKTQKILQCLI